MTKTIPEGLVRSIIAGLQPCWGPSVREVITKPITNYGYAIVPDAEVIDWSKPIETTCGKPARLVQRNLGGSANVTIQYHDVFWITYLFDDCGRCGLLTVRNVPEPAKVDEPVILAPAFEPFDVVSRVHSVGRNKENSIAVESTYTVTDIVRDCYKLKGKESIWPKGDFFIVQKRTDTCEDCGGTGRFTFTSDPKGDGQICGECNGSGRLPAPVDPVPAGEPENISAASRRIQTREADQAEKILDLEHQLSMYVKLFNDAVGHVDKVFQKCTEIPNPILPDFCRAGDDKFKAVVRLATKYKQQAAEIERLKAELASSKKQFDEVSDKVRDAHKVLDTAGAFDANGLHGQLIDRIKMLAKQKAATITTLTERVKELEGQILTKAADLVTDINNSLKAERDAANEANERYTKLFELATVLAAPLMMKLQPFLGEKLPSEHERDGA